MTESSTLRVQFIHGLESSPQSNKARALAQAFCAETPAMDTSDFETCVGTQSAALARFRPDVIVGSSFGGAVAVSLLERNVWRGPTLLLAQAAVLYRPDARLPEGVKVLLVHAKQDAVVPIEHSRALARTGTPGMVALIETDDDHALRTLVASGQLVELVRRLGS